jgi:hypothetical protein
MREETKTDFCLKKKTLESSLAGSVEINFPCSEE